MKSTGLEIFEELINLHNKPITLTDKYPRLRSLLERSCKEILANENIQFSNLFSRLNYVCAKTNLDKIKTYQLNTLRIHANKVLHSEFTPTEELYLHDLKSLTYSISHFYKTEIPSQLKALLPTSDISIPKLRQGTRYDRIRVEVTSIDDDFIYAIDEESPSNDPIRIKYNISGINEEFNGTVSKLWTGCQLNLLSVNIDNNLIYTPDFIVLEPDYLMDISSLAENFKDYGSHPLNYLHSKFETIPNTSAIILGNYANNVFDEFLFTTKFESVTIKDVFSKTFKQYPFEFSTCKDLQDQEKETKFKESVRLQFINIQKTVSESFIEEGYSINRFKAIVEPSFICEKLGIQGRLDFLQEDLKNLIELKSGRADDYRSPLKSKENNYIQMLLYLGVIQFNLGKNHKEINSYLFYSRYPKLYNEKPAWSTLKKAINLRNLIVSNEHEISTNDNISNQLIDQLIPDTLNTKQTTGTLWEKYQRPQIIAFKEVFEKASPLEIDYFHSMYSFITKEHLFSKLQMNKIDDERTTSYWLDFESKREGGEILYDLKINNDGNNSNDASGPPTITLSIPEYDQDFLPNFRVGDIIILYSRNSINDNVTNKQIFKGSIQNLTHKEITIRIRFKQRNQSVLPLSSNYAIEHDYLDSSYNVMYRGLYTFLQANQDRKDIILNQREPQQEHSDYLKNLHETPQIQQIVYKAKIAKDYFLLLGPPGTGKTSIAIKAMVEEFISEPSNNILLLSYTNRAVDEICDTLNNVSGNAAYIRIGSELSCDPKHRPKLLDEVIKDCNTRDQVKAKINEHRIFVGTVSSISGKSELFKLKTFQAAIIDEASQILEPSLIGILSMKNDIGGNAIKKFILIGDHKQLPAVVLQKESDSAVEKSLLNKIGLVNRKNSLFERLFSLHKSNDKSLAWDMLNKQGRMHPDIALFPNYSFYNSKLIPVPLKHQIGPLDYKISSEKNPIQKLVASKRLSFIPSEKHDNDKSNKTNTHEAKIVTELVKSIYLLYKLNNLTFSAQETIGIITPYRSQIALIKREIYALNIPELNNLSIDTVERYQGSQRDIIIYSFSINEFYQLDFLANNIEDEGQTIDRKLNVAITRARKQLFITGNPTILSNNLIYYRLIEFIRSKEGYVNVTPMEFISGNFEVSEINTDVIIGDEIHEPDDAFARIFERIIVKPIKDHPRTDYPGTLLGYDHDYIRMNVIEYGRTNFDQATLEHSSLDKVNLYCFYNMRKHYFSSIAIFKSFADYFEASFSNSDKRISFIDFGCGPLTSGLALNQHFRYISNFRFHYIGIDISNAMLSKAKEFSDTELFNPESKFKFVKSLNDISDEYWDSLFALSNTVLLNFSYLFGNLSISDTEKMADKINSILDKHPLNKYILIFQNSSMEKRNRTYSIFKKLVPRLASVTKPKIETVTYRNAVASNFDKSETVFYELLSN
jgi:superfamily I DNA and/or RNA helicase